MGETTVDNAEQSRETEKGTLDIGLQRLEPGEGPQSFVGPSGAKRRGRKARSIPLWMTVPEKYPGITDHFRNCKHHMDLLKRSEGLKTFMITGPDSGVGVSTISANLALIMAWDLPEQKILLVDTNIGQPTIHEAFDAPLSPGLLEYLIDGAPLDRVLCKTFMSNLYLLSAGKEQSHIKSPFDLSRFSTLLKEVRETYDFILIDAAPVLQSSNTRILCGKIDSTVVVVETNKTRFEVLLELEKQIGKDTRMLGTILNKRRFVIPKFLYRTM